MSDPNEPAKCRCGVDLLDDWDVASIEELNDVVGFERCSKCFERGMMLALLAPIFERDD